MHENQNPGNDTHLIKHYTLMLKNSGKGLHSKEILPTAATLLQ